MATTVTEHRVLSDAALATIDETTTTAVATGGFSLPTDFIDTDLVDRPVLIFMIDTGDSAGGSLSGLEIEIRSSSTNDFAVPDTNNVLEATATFNSNVAQPLHQIVNLASLDETVATNAFQFEITGGTGQAIVSAIYLQIKRVVPEPVNTITGT